jgi:hypothetical protein
MFHNLGEESISRSLLQHAILVNNVHIFTGSEKRSSVDDCARVRNDSFREDNFRMRGSQAGRERPEVGP